MGIGNHETNPTQATLFQLAKQLAVGFCGFFKHQFNGQNVSVTIRSYTTGQEDRHVNNVTTITNFLIEGIHPYHRVTVSP